METPEQESPAAESAETPGQPAAESRTGELLPEIQVEEAEAAALEGPAPFLPPRVVPTEPALSRPIHVEQGLLALEQLDTDDAFRLRDEGDVSRLAQDIARLGQLFPVEVRAQGERFQLLCGFRRVAALRFLQRDKVLARIHSELSDQDALLVALADALHAEPPFAGRLGGAARAAGRRGPTRAGRQRHAGPGLGRRRAVPGGAGAGD